MLCIGIYCMFSFNFFLLGVDDIYYNNKRTNSSKWFPIRCILQQHSQPVFVCMRVNGRHSANFSYLVHSQFTIHILRGGEFGCICAIRLETDIKSSTYHIFLYNICERMYCPCLWQFGQPIPSIFINVFFV